MKLRNKKTGEIVNAMDVDLYTDAVYLKISKDDRYDSIEYGSLAELNAEWEDYEDELLYVVSAEHRSGYQCVLKENYPEICEVAKELGIGFETEKECQKAVEKLKAWKRLIDKCNFRFNGIEKDNQGMLKGVKVSYDRKNVTFSESEKTIKDLMFLFGGEE